MSKDVRYVFAAGKVKTIFIILRIWARQNAAIALANLKIRLLKVLGIRRIFGGFLFESGSFGSPIVAMRF